MYNYYLITIIAFTITVILSFMFIIFFPYFIWMKFFSKVAVRTHTSLQETQSYQTSSEQEHEIITKDNQLPSYDEVVRSSQAMITIQLN